MNAQRTGLVLALLLLAAAWAPLRAQDARLSRRLDAPTARAVAALVDSAHAHAIPAEPLIQKALEGESKGAGGEAITAAVRRLSARLATARQALGAQAADAELVAAAAAMELGADAENLRSVRAQRPQGSLTGPLVGLAFLLQRGVPPKGSVEIVRSMLEARLSDTEFAALQRLVDQDIMAGAPAAAAAEVRARALIQHGPQLRPRTDGAAR
jgi:hypothetical protein